MIRNLQYPLLFILQMKNDRINLRRQKRLKELSVNGGWHEYNYRKNLSPGLSGAERKILAKELGI